ncbi:MAG TPA: M81 family metallopeptidase [Devosia sp.]|nr:M81 family metallopeptidase [Devosia sp.]
MRIGYLCITQESNDFNPLLTTLDDFRSNSIQKGAEVAASSKVGKYRGCLEAVAASGLDVEIVPILNANAVAGGRISREVYDYFAAAIREGLASAGKLDGLVLMLHGACAGEGIDDVEGQQAALCRQILGADVVIALGLDHHANVTHKLIDSVDAVAGHRTQPHDHIDTGNITTAMLLRVLSNDIKPATAWRKIPLLSHQEQFFTDRPPMKTWFDRARAIEAENPKVLQASNYPMQPWLNVAEGGWATVVCTDNDQALAEKLADELADLAWSLRDKFQEHIAVTVDDAVRQADAAPRGLVILSDTGDTVFGGSSGDSNLILESMLRLRIKGKALVPMIAPAAVAKLHAAGEGATVTLNLGGEIATEFFTPIEVTGIVRKLGDKPLPVAAFRSGLVDMGKVAIFEVGNVTLLLTELRGAGGNLPEIYEAYGVNVADYQMAVMKTATAFHRFDRFRSQVIRVDTMGPGQSDIFTLPWTRLPRPIYPLEQFTDRNIARS